MRLWQLYVVTIVLAVASVAGMFWFGALVQEARDSGDRRMACALWSPRGDPNDPKCPHK